MGMVEWERAGLGLGLWSVQRVLAFTSQASKVSWKDFVNNSKFLKIL